MLVPPNFYSVWPFFVFLAVLLALVATPAFAAADTPPSSRPQRITTLDGLRDFLALAAWWKTQPGRDLLLSEYKKLFATLAVRAAHPLWN
jgi:hypothetical protein